MKSIDVSIPNTGYSCLLGKEKSEYPVQNKQTQGERAKQRPKGLSWPLEALTFLL